MVMRIRVNLAHGKIFLFYLFRILHDSKIKNNFMDIGKKQISIKKENYIINLEIKKVELENNQCGKNY